MNAILETRVIKRARPATVVPILTFDPGPSVRQARDGRLISRGPGAVLLEDREDIDATGDHRGAKPLVRGARRPISLDELLNRGTITQRHYNAAQRFLDECSAATGGGGAIDYSGIRGIPTVRTGLPERQVSAITSVHRVIGSLGLNSGTVFWRVVFVGISLNACDEADHVEHGTSASLLKASLTALDELYNGRSARPGREP